MIELSTIRDLVAIFGVIAGFSYYVLTVRMNQKTMKINLTNNLLQQISTEEFMKKVTEMLYMKWEDYDDFEAKYGSDVDIDNYIMRNIVWGTYDSLGNLLKIGMADKDILYNSLFAYNSVSLWYKYEDVLNMNQKLYSGSDAWTGFEYLAEELYSMKQQKDSEWDVNEYSLTYTENRKQQATM